MKHCQVFHQKYISYFLYFCSKFSKTPRVIIDLAALKQYMYLYSGWKDTL